MSQKQQSLWNEKMERLSPKRLWEDIERPMLVDQLEYAATRSRFYRKKFEPFGRSGTQLLRVFEQGALPFTVKKEILQDQADDPPYGTLLAVPCDELVRINKTSGTTGRPLFIALTRGDIRHIQEAGARSFWCSGLRPMDTVVHCLNYCMWSGGLTDHLCLEQTGATVVPYGVGNTHQLLQVIRDLSPTVLSCTPSFMSRLEDMLRETHGPKPRELGLKLGLFGGEAGLQSPAFRKGIEERWGIAARDANYGLADVMSIFGAECDHLKGLHFHGQGILHAEIVDPVSGARQPLVPGVAGELVMTNLCREAQPLIRYRTGDVIEVTQTEPCACGRSSFCFKVIGRSDDMIVVRGINVFPSAVQDVIVSFAGTNGEYQVILQSPPPHDAVEIVVEYDISVGNIQVETVAERIRTALRQRLTFSATVRVVLPRTLGRTEGKISRVLRAYQRAGEGG